MDKVNQRLLNFLVEGFLSFNSDSFIIEPNITIHVAVKNNFPLNLVRELYNKLIL